MTTGTIYQDALVSVVTGTPSAIVDQIAIVSVVSEVPPLAGGALIEQIALVSLDLEYIIPQVYVPLPCGQFMQTFPYFIGEFQ